MVKKNQTFIYVYLVAIEVFLVTYRALFKIQFYNS